jgi:hypothetical protein
MNVGKRKPVNARDHHHPLTGKILMKPKRSLISAAVVLAIAAASPAYAVLQRMGPIDNSPAGGGFPAWFQDSTGVTLDFCGPSTQAELAGGWCVLLPGDTVAPQVFPDAFSDENFYVKVGNTLLDPGTGFKATLVVALEAAFAVGPVIAGDQMTFQRLRTFLPNVPFAGDYRVITPYTDISYFDMQPGDRIFETSDVGVACVGTFECTLNGPQGPFLLPSATAGGAEVPPMPDLLTAPAGTDPFFDAAVAAGAAPTADPQTGKKYIADPGRVGPVTGSQAPNFTAFDIDPTGATPGIPSSRNHNTFRVEVRVSQPDRNGHVFFTADGETNFGIQGGRLNGNAIPGNVSNTRSTYKADAAGNVTDLDAFAQATATLLSRTPTQPILPLVTPVISFYDTACGGALSIDPTTGATIVNQGPYTAPAGISHSLNNTGKDFWGQSSPGGVPPSHICIEDATSRNAAGQVVPTFTLVPVTDHVIINTAH